MTQTEFDGLMANWYRAKSIHSFRHTICRGPEYEALLAASNEIVPLLLKRLETDVSIFAQYLLEKITGAAAWVGEQQHGLRKIKVAESAKAWIRWGKEREQETVTELRGDLRSDRDRKGLLAWLDSVVGGQPVPTCLDETLGPTGFATNHGVLCLGRDAHASMERKVPSLNVTGKG